MLGFETINLKCDVTFFPSKPAEHYAVQYIRQIYLIYYYGYNIKIEHYDHGNVKIKQSECGYRRFKWKMHVMQIMYTHIYVRDLTLKNCAKPGLSATW